MHPLESSSFLIACLRFKTELCPLWPFDTLAFSFFPKYKKLTRMVKDFQPYCDLWTTVSDWLNWCNSWMDGPLTEIEAEQLEKNVNESFKTMQKCVRQFKNSPACQGVATEFRDKIEEFKLYVPLIQGLNNPGMGSRHWKMLSEEINMDIEPDPDLTLRRCLDMELQDHIETITKIAEIAGKEYAIESALDKMESEWSSVLFAVSPYKDTGTFILKDTDEASQLLDDHIVMTQSMSFSPFKKHFEERMNTWENKLKMTQDVLDEWLNCQCSWLYLEPIFSSEDIKRQLPEESERFDVVDKDWRIVMKKANENPEVSALIKAHLKKCNKLLELVQKGLSEYLETKRGAFPRFYFLSDDELLEILSQTKDPTAVQPHLRKCFENIARLQFQEDLQITHMYSSEGEEVELSAAIYPTENVEEWLLEVEKSMKASVRDNIERSVGVYPETPRTTWVLQWPGQVTIVGCQIFWTKEVSEALESGDLSSRLFPQLSAQLADLVAVVRGQLSKMQRAVMSALIVIEVHAKDVAAKLIEENVASVNDFEWISQLRSYWTEGDLYIRAVNAEFLYGYEYLGNTGRLVITPLTDRCYLTLTGALHLKFGGAPAGPAGTGKTETTKELGKALAVQTVVFNCSDQLDFMAMGKFFKGLASSGAWACFDEFNRIDMEVLSVVAQQITTIQKVSHFMFEGKEIPLVPSCAVFITMNPGYAGRTELPENLKALFRPVAMMVPDYSMIAEISLYSFGFNEAKVLAKKITTTFKLLSEQLSSQDHYDFGMRAVKTVISTAGNLKKENPTMDEDLICLRAIRDANIPKFLQDDLKLFRGIVSDLFPKIKEQPVDYGILEEAIRKTCINKSFVTKCIQLYETTVVRHGLMLVGPAGSGKTKCYEVLAAAMTSLQGQPAASGGNYEPVSYSVLNPKSITMGQLYGEFNLLTHEWTDGILSSLIRQGAMATDNIKKWYMFDGPVDALWIENMNTVLDDNKKLCLSSGEIIKMTESMTMMFEVQDLAVASPATVSRCGMVYLEPSILGLEPFTECWLQKLPDIMKRFSKQLTSLFSRFLKVTYHAITSLPWVFYFLVVLWTQSSLVQLHILQWSYSRGKVIRISRAIFMRWEKWLDPTAKFTMVPDTNYCDIIVPTVNTVRMAHLLELLLINCKPVLCIGPTGTGKTLTITDKLLKSLPLKFISHFLTFSAQTSANQTQDLIDSKLEKRRKGVFGPAVGRYFIFFIDDLNMPTLETYGAQPPIELLRQWMDHKGWYDRKCTSFLGRSGFSSKLVDINFVCAMGPPGGGRNAVTPRFTRHFNYLSFTEMDDDSKKTIFSNILGSWMGKYTDAVKDLNKPLVDATIYVYLTITSQLLPTPTKSHYTFNLRDLSKVFQGMLMAQPSDIKVSPAISTMMPLRTETFQLTLQIIVVFLYLFRARLRQFPSLVNCCTIDWFNEWPAEALQCVAFSFLHENPHLGASTDTVDGMVGATQSTKCLVYLAELGRHNYVTPKSYLDFLNIFCSLIGKKKEELKTAKNRMEGGLDKVCLSQPVQSLLLQVDTAVAEETRTAVQAEEEKANEKAQKAQAIADDAQKDLAEALPALDAALASLRNLKKNDVTEVRAMQRPPPGVKMVIEAVCIMKEIKPKKVAGEKLGTKVDDYWEPGRGLLQDPGKFLDSLFKYDKDNIPDAVIKAIQPYIDSKDFQPAAIAKVSKACTSICQWVRAMHKYHFVAKVVEPKRQALREAEEDLRATQEVLDEAKQRLQEVENGIAALQAKYNGCIAKKEELEMKCEQCQQRLGRAATLINSLADEKVRWKDTVENLDYKINNIAGDVLLAAGFVAYLGPFTGQYRVALCNEWLSKFSENNIPHTEEPNLISTLGDPVEIRSWQVAGLPNDMLSVENGVITRFSQRWTHYIDPQRQANKWIKNLEKANSLEVAKMSDRDFLSSLEKAITYGKPFLLENVGEELDPALEPILLKQTYKQQGRTVLKLGDTVIPYNEDFKLYITTNLSNPHYSPEISTKVTLINFTISPSGLEDQLLGQVVAEERPDLEEARNQLILSNAEMQQELKEIEDQILHRLSTSEGNPVDDLELISALEASKIKAGEIQTKVKAAEQTEVDINTTRLQYAPVAVRAQILYFCVSDLSSVDPMYQYSLEWFLNIFLMGISNSEKAGVCQKWSLPIPLFTPSLIPSLCLHAGLLNLHASGPGRWADEWRYLLSGGTVKEVQENPAPDWLNERAWGDILALSNLKNFSGFAGDFAANLESFRAIFDSQKPHRQPLPGKWDTELDAFQKLLVLRCLRGDKITNAMQDFVALNLDRHFIEPQTTDLSVVFKESSSTIPLVFVLSPGTDPAADLYKFAAEMRFSEKLSAISLGQGQGPRAEAMMCSAMKKGNWVFFQNCHLAPSWMPSLERLIECIDPNEVHQNFRLWLTSLPSNHFPVSILQNSSKMTIEPPRGVKANLLKSYISFSDNFLNSCPKVTEFKSLLLSLCFFHGNMLERRKFGPLGFNIPYEFTDGDLRICISQLNMFLSEYKEVPYKVLKYTAGEINYGGRVTDDWDRRCMMNILEDFYKPEVLTPEFAYSESGVYRQISTSSGLDVSIRSLPLNDSPELFGLHDNANITFAQKETFALEHRPHLVEETANEILAKLPDPMDVQEVVCKYPLLYEESMNTVLVQEVIRYNNLLEVIAQSLKDLLKALKGLVVMSSQLELMADSLYNNSVPTMWNAKAYPSLKPLASWVNDLVQRVEFLQKWISHGIPPVFWISGFFFPQAFLTGTLQNFARRSVISIDNISFGFEVRDSDCLGELSCPPSDGCYIYGLFLEGARWDPSAFQLAESRPKELYSEMAVIWLLPVANRKPPAAGVYLCPIYKTLTRAGTLSTTGHSTNYVIAVEIPTDKPEKHWIKRGTALICALDF
uniref:Dynein axonemal heavy chain 1 n=1 Tax=Coturnix japonica TaxID=93934 RepID=A0A8C2TLH0_COTJA